MSAIATDANPASSSAPRRVRVGEVERAAVGHLVVGGERIDQRRALGLLGTGAHHTIVVWDSASRRRVVTLTGHTARIRGLAFTRDGNLVSGAEDGRIVHWTLDIRAARDLITHPRS